MKRFFERRGGSGLRFRLVMLAGLSLAGSPAGAQFRIETRAVLVDVFVSDGGPVPGLRHADFELYEEGERVSFRLLAPGSLPVTVLFAMDVSASTVGERQRTSGKGRPFLPGVSRIAIPVRWPRLRWNPSGSANSLPAARR